jgi:hypothetical protein
MGTLGSLIMQVKNDPVTSIFRPWQNAAFPAKRIVMQVFPILP